MQLRLFRNETALSRGIVRSNITGIALIELLIVIILISGLAAAFLNFRDEFVIYPAKDGGLSSQDSALYEALDVISDDLYLARRKPPENAIPLAIEHLGSTDKIRIKYGGRWSQYLIDENSNLIKQTGDNLQRLIGDIASLKVQELGKQTIVLTLSVKPHYKNGEEREVRSYSRVVTVNFPLQ